MIKNFKQFINESSNYQETNSTINAINEPVSDFIRRFQERSEMFIDHINELTAELNNAVEEIMDLYADIIVGEPIIKVDSNLYDIYVTFNTNIPNTEEAWETDESPAAALDSNIYDTIGKYKNISSIVTQTPNEDGNCTIDIGIDIISPKNFGDFENAVKALGQEY